MVGALQRHRSRHPGVDDAAGEGPAPLGDCGVRRGQLGVEPQPGLGLLHTEAASRLAGIVRDRLITLDDDGDDDALAADIRRAATAYMTR